MNTSGKCFRCGEDMSGTDASSNYCKRCQAVMEYYPLLEPIGKVTLICPHCKKDIIAHIAPEFIKEI